MRSNFLTIALLAAPLAADAAALAPREEKPVIVRLVTGAEVSGVIVDDGFQEATGITMRRDDNGGILELRWDQIQGDDVAAIKQSYGFVGDDLPPILMKAIKITTRSGKEFVGLDGGNDGTNRLLRRRGLVTPVPMDQIAPDGIENVMVDALEVEMPVNVLERYKREHPLREPVDSYNLGLYAEALTLYDAALEAFDRVPAEFAKHDLIETRRKVIAAKMKEKDAAVLLNGIRQLRLHREFDAALKQVEQFAKSWPNSALLADVMKEQKLLLKMREDDLMVQIRADFFTALRRQCDLKALDTKLGLGAAMTWAKEQAFKDAMAAMLKQADYRNSSEKEVLDLFEKRGKTGSETTASYGGGTFILGAEEARAGILKKKEGEAEEAADPKKEPQTLEEKIKKKLEDREKDRKKRNEKQKTTGEGGIADVPPTPDEWWAASTVTERSAFLLAFFAEHSGKVTISRISTRDCNQGCGGTGFLTFFGNNTSQSDSGGNSVIPCARCKTLGFDRVVHFK